MAKAGALFRRGGNEGAIQGHTVGNALVLHGRERISSQAQSLALAVAKDPQHDVVVLDMADRMPMHTWESVASALPRWRRAGIRLVICGDHPEPSSLVGQWLSERLNRPVITPHGKLTRSAAGSLFVHSGPGTGWIRYRPSREPKWEGKRFPQPVWDHTVADDASTSSTGVAEPVPGGAWIHDTTEAAVIDTHREWLLTMVPCQPDDMVVVLGCPGTRPLPLDDVFRFYRKLDDEARQRVRFVGFGPVDVPGADALGQALADALASVVVCYTGIPVGSPAQPRMFTVDSEGRLCWQAFAEELAYAPRERPAAPPRTPQVVSHRAPMDLGEQIEPGVYWYADDAVIEVLQSGLWVRPSDLPRDAELVRAAHADAERHTLVYDDANEHRAARMRTLAEDVAGQLDPATRARTELVPASMLAGEATRVGAAAHGRLTDQGSVAAESWDESTIAAEAPVPAATPIGWREATAAPAVEPVSAPEPVAAPEPVGQFAPAPAVSMKEEFSRQLPVAAQAPEPPVDLSALEPPVDLSALAPPVDLSALAPLTLMPVVPSSMTPATPASGAPLAPSAGVPIAPSTEAPFLPPAPEPPAEAQAPAGMTPAVTVPDVAPVPSATAPGVTPATAHTVPPATAPGIPPATAPAVPPATAPTVPPATAPGIPPATSPGIPPATAPTVPPASASTVPPATAPTAPPADQAAGPRPTGDPAPRPARRGPRLQPVPDRAAAALPPSRGLNEERAWLRRSLSRDYDSVASMISRVLSEQPGLQGGNGVSSDDVMTDSVALRLYLTRQGRAIDSGLRAASKGPHVPLARCVFSGLNRLPSHRGATTYPATPSKDVWRLLAGRKLLTEWGFLNALTTPSPDLSGDTDVLIWSMTARRTKLLEPDGDERAENRVLFLPGSNFKVLELVEPGDGVRGRVLLREVAANEINPDGKVQNNWASLDELAATSLRRCLERWSEAEPSTRVGPATQPRFGMLPGLAEIEEDDR